MNPPLSINRGVLLFFFLFQTSTVDCGGHIVTITEFDDTYGAVKEPENEFEAVDEELMEDSELTAGGSTGDQRKVSIDFRVSSQ